MKQFKEKEEPKPIPEPKLKEGTPTRVMLGGYPNFNTGASINQRTILLEMDNIGGGAPNTIWKVILMAYT